MDFFKEIYKQPFFWGLVIGLILTIFTYYNSIKKSFGQKKIIKELKNEIEELKKHLYNQMNITSKGTEETKSELDKLRIENQNLKKNISILDTKPGRSELKTLHMYENAINTMYERSPGFSSAWQSILKDSEKKLKDSEMGLIPLVKKVFALPVNNEKASEKTQTSKAKDTVIEEVKDSESNSDL